MRAAALGATVIFGVGLLACGAAPATGASAALPSPHLAPRPVAAQERQLVATESLPFMHDDYARALAESKRTGRPLFVDAWARWCHSCQSMRAYVLTDPSLAPLAKDFVWLTIDTDKESNAAFVERFSNQVWPTLWVIDPEHESATLRWDGTATAPELLTLLATVRAGGEAGAAETTMAFLHANQAAARGEGAEAEKGYRAVLAEPGFAERPRAAEALVGLLASKKDFAACTELALVEAPAMPPGTSRATLLVTGLSCARQAKRADDLRKLAEAVELAVADSDPRTLADDRSALFEELVEAKKEQGDEVATKVTAEAWVSFLEREASRAPTKQARAVFDPHRYFAYLAAGRPESAIPVLLESERDFPDNANSPLLLALAYRSAKRPDEAKAAIERAATRVYGPRSLRVFALAADLAKARGDIAGERAALEQALARTSHAVLNDNQKKLRAALEKRAAALPR